MRAGLAVSLTKMAFLDQFLVCSEALQDTISVENRSEMTTYAKKLL